MTAVEQQDLEAIATTIWDTLFDFPLERSDASRPGGESTVTSVVHIDGAWHGAVLLQCAMALAATVTSAMFQTGAEPRTDDVADALGELANMIAGNVKALLPEPCGISLPAVAFGMDYQLNVVGTAPVASAAFTCAGHSLVITLLHRSAERRGS